MRTINLNSKRSFSFYESTRELPIERFIECRGYWDTAAAEVASPVAVQPTGLMALLEASKKRIELLGATGGLAMDFLVGDVAATSAELSFVALVGAVDGRTLDEFTEDTLRYVVDLLKAAGLPKQFMEEHAATLNRLFEAELSGYLSSFYDVDTVGPFIDQQLHRGLLITCDYASTDQIPPLRLPEQTKDALLDIVQPAPPTADTNRVAQKLRVQALEGLCTLLVTRGHLQPRQLSVLDFACKALVPAAS